MKNLLFIFSLVFSVAIFSAHHEEDKQTESENGFNFAYTSSYTIPAGSQPQRIERLVLDNLATLEENGYYNCGLLRHQFGGERAYCGAQPGFHHAGFIGNLWNSIMMTYLLYPPPIKI